MGYFSEQGTITTTLWAGTPAQNTTTSDDYLISTIAPYTILGSGDTGELSSYGYNPSDSTSAVKQTLYNSSGAPYSYMTMYSSWNLDTTI